MKIKVEFATSGPFTLEKSSRVSHCPGLTSSGSVPQTPASRSWAQLCSD